MELFLILWSCTTPQNFQWSASAWSQCSLSHGRCGGGVRRREVRCVERVQGGEGASITVMEKFCDSQVRILNSSPPHPLKPPHLPLTQERPDSESECQEPCPGHCVLAPWSTWSPCRDVSNSSSTPHSSPPPPPPLPPRPLVTLVTP